MSTVIRVNDSTRRFWTTLPTHPVSLRLGWHIINKPADCQPRKKNSWQLNVCVDGEIGNNCWGEEGGERHGIDVLDANAFECVIKSSDMVVICKADQLPTTRTLDEKKERKKGKKRKRNFVSYPRQVFGRIRLVAEAAGRWRDGKSTKREHVWSLTKCQGKARGQSDKWNIDLGERRSKYCALRRPGLGASYTRTLNPAKFSSSSSFLRQRKEKGPRRHCHWIQIYYDFLSFLF